MNSFPLNASWHAAMSSELGTVNVPPGAVVPVVEDGPGVVPAAPEPRPEEHAARL